MDKAFIAQRVANKVWSAENAVDAALAEAAALMTEITTARQELKVAAGTDAKAMKDLVAAIAALGEARTALVTMHDELAEVKLRCGIRTKLVGGFDKRQASTTEELRAVS
ncbi:MAG TPA: hypothetical protein VD906_14810 [Caulobacteraceae bacterium]|nr:hypothetical protein [Caulobacteraceae bacterium]